MHRLEIVSITTAKNSQRKVSENFFLQSHIRAIRLVFLCRMKSFEPYRECHIEVRSYFRVGGKVVGTEVCDNEIEARIFAKHQVSLYPYVEIVLVNGMVQANGIYEPKSSELLGVFR